jgi:hypothetical protein
VLDTTWPSCLQRFWAVRNKQYSLCSVASAVLFVPATSTSTEHGGLLVALQSRIQEFLGTTAVRDIDCAEIFRTLLQSLEENATSFHQPTPQFRYAYAAQKQQHSDCPPRVNRDALWPFVSPLRGGLEGPVRCLYCATNIMGMVKSWRMTLAGYTT